MCLLEFLFAGCKDNENVFLSHLGDKQAKKKKIVKRYETLTGGWLFSLYLIVLHEPSRNHKAILCVCAPIEKKKKMNE